MILLDQKGMALLELAVLSMVMVLLLTGGVLMAERFHHFGEASRMVDRYLNDDSVSPLSLEQFNGTFQLEVNDSGIESYIESMVNSAANEVSAYIERFELLGPYSIQMGYRVLEIDQTTGEVVSLRPMTCVRRDEDSLLQLGALCAELGSALDLIDQEIGENGVSLYATPTAFHLRDLEPNHQYLPFSVVMGLRVSWSIEKNAGEIATRFNLPSEAGDQKIALLRGDLTL